MGRKVERDGGLVDPDEAETVQCGSILFLYLGTPSQENREVDDLDYALPCQTLLLQTVCATFLEPL